ncbi:MAG: nucleotidyltransferase domain-containing protein, partial [Promethearchaeota archaeon]
MVGLREIAKNLRPTQTQIDQIRRYKSSIESIIKNELSRYNIRVYYAGSYAKNTGMRNHFDMDLVIRFPSNPSYTTNDYYELVYEVLRRNKWQP